MNRLIVTILANALGLWVADKIIPGFLFSGTTLELFIAAFVLALINWIVHPLVRFLATPFVWLTLGLATLAISAAMLWLLDQVIPYLVILNLKALVLATLLFGAINLVLKHPEKTGS